MALFHKGFHDFSENMRVLYEMKGDAQEAIECLEIQRATQLSLLGQDGGEELESPVLVDKFEDKEPQAAKKDKKDKKEHK